MSRQIDVSNPENLSDEDRAYLLQRGRDNVVAHIDYMARVNAARDNAVGAQKPDEPAADVVVEEVEEPYSEWKVDELRKELRHRKLSDDGVKDELVARLEQDDASA